MTQRVGEVSEADTAMIDRMISHAFAHIEEILMIWLWGIAIPRCRSPQYLGLLTTDASPL